MDTKQVKVSSIITSSLQNEYMDQLRDSTGYVKEIKFHGNKLQTALEKDVEVLNDFYDADEQCVVSLTRNYEQLIKSIASMTPDDVVTANQLLQLFNNDKEGFLERNSITLKQLQK
jgi:hypothetical protein